MAFTLVTVSGTYTESGVPASGKVTFKRSTSLQDAAGNLISPNDLRTVTLDASGSISIQLEATDQAGIDPTGAVYTVTEQINKQGRRVYTIQVPAASADTGIDLADVAPVVAGPQNFTYALQSSLATETTARTSADNTLQGNIDAKPDTFLELTDTPTAYTGQAGKAAIVNPGETAIVFGTVAGGGASLSNNTPLVESGAGAAGTGTAASRDDHVHPAEDLSGYATTAALNTETSARTSGDAASAQKSANLSDLVNAGTARTNLGLGGAATENVGTTAGTVAAGDDSRITGAAQKASNLSDLGSAATARTNLGLGTAATRDVPASGDASTTQVVKGDDTRLTDARTPTAHKTSHTSTGSDPLGGNLDANARVTVAKAGTPIGTRRTVNFIDGTGITSTVSDAGAVAERVDVTIAAAATESNLTLSDVTTDDVSTTRHGFAPKAPNDTARFLRGDASWAVPPDTGFANPMTTQDDLIVGGASGAPGRLGKGTDGQVLTVDPTTHHLVWATPAAGGSGTVTSVALTVPSDKAVSGSPITGSGTLAITDTNQSANTVKAGPSSGAAAAPAYRALVAADIPAAYLTPGNTNLEGAFASRPAASVAGRLYIANDQSILSRDTGSAWNEYYVAGLQQLQAPVEANFAWVNQGSATVVSTAGYSVIAGADTSDSVKMRVKSLAATSNYTAIMYSRYNGTGLTFNQFGLVLRDSASGKFIMFGYQYGSGGLIMEYTNPTTFSANLGTYSGGPFPFLRVQDDGTNRIFSTSPDGITWTVVNTSTRTTFITADQIGYSLNPRNATSVSFTVYSLRET